MRTIQALAASLVLAAGCTRQSKSASPSQAGTTPVVPVVMPARELMVRDLQQMRQVQAASKTRKAEFDAVIEGRDH
ncbi:MAG: hypothetical protein R3F56_24560 [Planctomycetota bacterium]